LLDRALMDMRRVIGSNFARLRKSKGLTQEAVAEKSGFSQSYIGWLERGRRNPTAISIWMLAQAVEAMPADLMQPVKDDQA
jgi:transcriptional regulator with XRE-family HTH domain